MQNKGVTPLLGMIFILMICMIMLSIIQAYQVPKWSEEAEMQHYNKLLSELSELPSALTQDKVETIKIDAGLIYPKYPFLLTPPPAPTTVYSKNSSVNIQYTVILPNGTQKTFTIVNKTYTLFFRPNYVYLSIENNLGIIVFENGILFRKGNSFVIPVTQQTLFTSNKITFPIIKTDIKSISTTSTLNLKLIPVKSGYVVATNFKITFETEFGSYWNDTLSSWSNFMNSHGYNVTYSVKPLPGGLYIVNVQAVGNIGKTFIVDIPVWYITTSSSPSGNSTPSMIITNPSSLSIQLGTVSEVTVWVLNSVGQPIPNVRVNYSISGNAISVVSVSPVTDSNGEAYFYFKANTLGSGIIKFSVGSVTTSVPYTVTSSGAQKQVVLNPLKDTFVSSTAPNTNFGKETYLKLDSGDYVLVQFDLSSIPKNSVIQSAKLKLYMYRNSATNYVTVTVHHILQDWSEYNVTWNNKPAYSQQVINYQIIPSIYNTWIVFDVTSDVQKIVDGAVSNYGWILIPTIPSGTQYFYSKEWNLTVCPKLVVSYTPTQANVTTTTTTVPTTTTTVTPTPTPTPTPPLHTSTLYVKAYRIFWLFGYPIAVPISVQITYTGDLTGSGTTPFTITNSVYGNSSFTVTLTAPQYYGILYTFDHWNVDGVDYYTRSVTVTVPDNSFSTATAYYRLI